MSLSRLFFLLPLLLPLYVVRFQIGPLPTTVLEVIILTLTVAWIVTRKEEGIRQAWKRSSVWHLPAGLWITAGAIGVITAWVNGFDPVAALGLFRAYFVEPLVVFFIGFDLIRTEEDRDRLWRSFCGVTILLGIWAGVQMLTGWGIPHPWDAWPGRRATGPFPFPNALALFVVPIVAAAICRGARRASRTGWQQTDRGARRAPLQGAWVEIATVIIGIAAIFFAQSDGGLVAVAAAFFVTLLLQKKTRVIAVALAVLAVIAVFAVAPLRGYVTNTLLLNDWSGRVRKVIWQESWTMLTDVTTPAGIARPIFGAGLASYPAAIAPYHTATWMEIFQYPHNILLNLWSETGIIGIVAFGWIVTTWIRRGKPDALPVVAAILVHGLVDVPYFKNDLAVAFWLLILITTLYENKKPAH